LNYSHPSVNAIDESVAECTPFRKSSGWPGAALSILARCDPHSTEIQKSAFRARHAADQRKRGCASEPSAAPREREPVPQLAFRPTGKVRLLLVWSGLSSEYDNKSHPTEVMNLSLGFSVRRVRRRWWHQVCAAAADSIASGQTRRLKCLQ